MQHESTDCWELALFLQTSSCFVQLSADAALDRFNRTGQNTPRNQNRWEKNSYHKETCCTDSSEGSVTESTLLLRATVSFLLNMTGSVDGLQDEPTRRRTSGSQGGWWLTFVVGKSVWWLQGDDKKNDHEDIKNIFISFYLADVVLFVSQYHIFCLNKNWQSNHLFHKAECSTLQDTSCINQNC